MPNAATIGAIDVPDRLLNLGGIAQSILMIAYFAAGVFFIFQLVVGGIAWTSSGGDPKALDAARGRITNAIIGLVIVVSAFAITLLITTILGINIFIEGGVIINP
jgi:hypothetical protein